MKQIAARVKQQMKPAAYANCETTAQQSSQIILAAAAGMAHTTMGIPSQTTAD